MFGRGSNQFVPCLSFPSRLKLLIKNLDEHEDILKEFSINSKTHEKVWKE